MPASPRAAGPASVRRQRAWLVGLTLLAYLSCVGVKLGVHQFDISRFVVAGDRFFSPKDLAYPIAVKPHSDGYDGQFFYRLALDPLDTRRVAYGITMESHPVVRAQRIAYPAAAWALSLGQGAAVPYALVAVNLLCVALIGWVAALLAAHFAVPARLGLLIPFHPGFVIALCCDTAEIFATTLALSGALAAATRRWPLAALLAGAAVLARETTLLYLIGFGLVAVADGLRRRSFDRRIAWCLVPPIVFVLWQAVLKSIWGTLPFEDLGHHDLSTVPLVDYARAVAGFGLAVIGRPFSYHAIFDWVSCLSVGVFVGFVAIEAVKRPAFLSFVIPWSLYVALAALFTDAIWGEPLGYLRILCDVYVLGIATLIAAGNEAALRAMVPFVAVAWTATVVFIL
ncbi:hypothetical protein [uncultured Sphingomonas sp.]|uniref:hypothetical protein n=1 Tax=uncultured Sphingomonas sp. TaxID=158754 RepID=UPI0035CA8ED9